MLKSFIKIAVRSLLKFKGYTAINLIGLSLGLLAGSLILIYIADELSFDEFHVNKERLYRVNTAFSAGGASDGAYETNGWPIGKILEKDFPEVEKVLYTRSASFLLINHEEKRIKQNNHFATPEFFQMFTFPLKEGDPATALTEPYTLVLSEEMEKKYFPEGDALNKTLTLADTLLFKVTGVMKNIPANSHIQADMILSIASYQKIEPGFSFDDGWGNINMRNYVLLKPHADFSNFQAKAKNLYMERVGEQLKKWGVSAYLSFEPMRNIYLRSTSGNGMGPLGSLSRLYLLGAIAAFVILLACINFINLTTARSLYRAKEVGLRKVVGSSRRGLIGQFLSESFVITTLSWLVSLALLGTLFPFFNELLDKNYNLSSLFQPKIIILLIALLIVVALMAGYYPAFVISRMKPSEVLKGKLQTSASGTSLRRSLVVFQFIISVGLVTSTLVVSRQLKFMQEQDLGFDKEQVLIINSARVNSPNPNAFASFKDQLQSMAIVKNVSFTNALPGTPGWVGQVAYVDGKSADDAISFEYMAVDETYLDLLNLQLLAGKNFSTDRQTELKNGLIINETAAHMLGWSSAQEAVGKKIASLSGYPAGEVIGVIKDYHKEGLQQKIGPVAMDYAPENSYLYAIKYTASNTKELLEKMEELWKSSFPGHDFNYFFLDDSFARQYKAEEKLARVFGLFSLATIIIAVIGLLGLVSFIVATRTKEIGIRKIMGADTYSISLLISKEFLWIVLIANLISAPLLWYLATNWLEKFAYRIEMNISYVVIPLIVSIAITLLTVSVQSVKAAFANPIDSLRNE